MSDGAGAEGSTPGMRIEFERSGGFAGLRLRTEVDTRSLPEEEAREIRALVERADFFSLPTPPTPPGGADRFEYALTVSAGDRRRTVRLTDGAVPDPLRPLLDHLSRRAKRRPGADGAAR